MGTGETRLETGSPTQLEREVEQIRDDLTGIIRDLDRRRHELLDWRLQLRRNAVPVGVSLGTLSLLVGGAAALTIWRHRRQQRVLSRVGRLRSAVSRMIDHPERVAVATPSMGQKALAAVLSTAIGIAMNAVAHRFVRPWQAA